VTSEGWPGYRAGNALRGALIYGGGDALAAWLLGEFSPTRLAGMAALGGTLYALEVPNWFHWIDRRVGAHRDWGGALPPFSAPPWRCSISIPCGSPATC
jgi:hypothetical protein